MGMKRKKADVNEKKMEQKNFEMLSKIIHFKWINDFFIKKLPKNVFYSK